MVERPSTRQDSWRGSHEQARGHRCGWPQGSHWVWEGTPSLVQSDWSTYICPGPTRTSRTPCRCLALLALMGGRDVSSCACRSWHSTASSCLSFTMSTGLVVPTKPPHHRAASAATVAVVYREVVDGKKAKFMRNFSMHTFVRDRGLRKDCAQRIPSALSTQASPILRRQFCFDLKTKSAWNWLAVLLPAMVGGSLLRCWTLSLHCAGVELVETVVGQACSRTGLHSNCVRLPREACYQIGGWTASDGEVGSLLSVIHSVSYDYLFTALELSVLKPWSVRLANESDCTVIVCSSHVKRVSTRSYWSDFDTGCFVLVFSGHGKVLRVRRSPADLPSAPCTCPSCSGRLTFLASTCPLEKKDVLRPAHLQELYTLDEELGPILSQKIIRPPFTQCRNNRVLFFVMVIYFEKTMERLYSGDKRSIFGTNWYTVNVGLMKCGRAQWQEAERQQWKISILYWPISTRNYLSPSSSRSFRTQSHWSFITGQCMNSERFLRVHFSHHMCNQFSFHHEFRIDIGRTKFWANDRRYSSRLWILWTKNTKILIQFTWKHRVLHGTSRKRGRNIKIQCIGSTSNLLKRKELSSVRHDRMPSSFTTHTPSLLYPEGYRDGNWRNHIQESVCVTPASSEDFLWRHLDETIGFRSCWRWWKLPTNPTEDQKKQLLEQGDLFWQSNHLVRVLRKSTNVSYERTGRLVSSCVPVSVERLDQDKDADDNVDADQVRTGRPVESEQSIGLFTHREEIDIDFRVSGLPHAGVKQGENFRVRELVKKIESHLHRQALQVDLQQNNANNPFSEESKGDDSWNGQCRALRVARNNSKSAMLRMPSLLESRSSLLRLWTSLERERIQSTFSPMAIGCFLNPELRH